MLTIAADGVECDVLPFAASLAAIRVPDREGRSDNVILSLPDAEAYRDRSRNHHFGAFIGRVANRIGGASFELDGSRWVLDANDGPNCLHGGSQGWGQREWTVAHHGPSEIELSLTSEHLDQGFPGRVVASVRYRATPGELTIDAWATTDAPTVVAMTSHPYWNLSGAPSSIDDHHLMVAASHVLEVGGGLIPTGPVTPLDRRFDGRVLTGESWDHCLVLDRDRTDGSGLDDEQRNPAAVLSEPRNGRRMTLFTSEPGIQLYTADSLGAPFGPRAGVCLEAQLLPDAVHHPEWPGPSPVLRPGERSRWWIRHRFDVMAR